MPESLALRSLDGRLGLIEVFLTRRLGMIRLRLRRFGVQHRVIEFGVSCSEYGPTVRSQCAGSGEQHFKLCFQEIT